MTEGFENTNDSKKDIEIINEVVCDYIYNSESITEIEDIVLMEKLTDILLNTKEVYYNFRDKHKYSFKKNNKIVENFLESLSSNYKEYYKIRIIDGSFEFDEETSEKDFPFNCYDPIDKKRIIYIPLKNTLEDSFAIVHELMHDINLDINNHNLIRNFYTESLSILCEMLLDDYLGKNNTKGYKNNMDYSLFVFKSKAIAVNLNIKLIKAYLDKGYIDEYTLDEIILSYPEEYDEDLFMNLYKIKEDEELNIEEEQPYIIGCLIAAYMYDRIKSNKYNLMELFELNQMLKYYNFDQVLDYLDLDYNEIDLEPSAYKKLEEKYKKYLKSR